MRASEVSSSPILWTFYDAQSTAVAQFVIANVLGWELLNEADFVAKNDELQLLPENLETTVKG